MKKFLFFLSVFSLLVIFAGFVESGTVQTVYWNPECANDGDGTAKQCAAGAGQTGSKNTVLANFDTVIHPIFNNDGYDDGDTLVIWTADDTYSGTDYIDFGNGITVGPATGLFTIIIDTNLTYTGAGQLFDMDGGATLRNIEIKGTNTGYHNTNNETIHSDGTDVFQVENFSGILKIHHLNISGDLYGIRVIAPANNYEFHLYDNKLYNPDPGTNCVGAYDGFYLNDGDGENETNTNLYKVYIYRNYAYDHCHNFVNLDNVSVGQIYGNEGIMDYVFGHVIGTYDKHDANINIMFNKMIQRSDSHEAGDDNRRFNNWIQTLKCCDAAGGECEEAYTWGDGCLYSSVGVSMANRLYRNTTFNDCKNAKFFNNTFYRTHLNVVYTYFANGSVPAGLTLVDYTNNAIYDPSFGITDTTGTYDENLVFRNADSDEIAVILKNNFIQQVTETGVYNLHLFGSEGDFPSDGGETGANILDNTWTASDISGNREVTSLGMDSNGAPSNDQSVLVDNGLTINYSGWTNQPQSGWEPDKGIDAACMSTCGGFTAGNWSKCVDVCRIDRDLQGDGWDVGAFELNQQGEGSESRSVGTSFMRNVRVK